MQVARTEDYAVRAMVDLATHPEARVEDIAARTDIPAAHLAKVIQALARAGLVETTRGRRGGVRLARAPEGIRLLEVIHAVGGVQLFRCPRQGDGCPRDPECALYRFWSGFQAETEARFGGARLSDLLRNCRAA